MVNSASAFGGRGSRWLVAVGVAMIVYAVMLTAYVYHSQTELRKESDANFISDERRLAGDLHDLAMERVGIVRDMVGMPEIAHYYTNKLLGMSYRYGLGASAY